MGPKDRPGRGVRSRRVPERIGLPERWLEYYDGVNSMRELAMNPRIELEYA